MAGIAGDVQTAAAVPDDGFAATVVLADSPVKLSTFAAENNLCKTMPAGVALAFAAFAGADAPSADRFFLHQQKDGLRDELF